jgi:hypothetical protein
VAILGERHAHVACVGQSAQRRVQLRFVELRRQQQQSGGGGGTQVGGVGLGHTLVLNQVPHRLLRGRVWYDGPRQT